MKALLACLPLLFVSCDSVMPRAGELSTAEMTEYQSLESRSTELDGLIESAPSPEQRTGFEAEKTAVEMRLEELENKAVAARIGGFTGMVYSLPVVGPIAAGWLPLLMPLLVPLVGSRGRKGWKRALANLNPFSSNGNWKDAVQRLLAIVGAVHSTKDSERAASEQGL